MQQISTLSKKENKSAKLCLQRQLFDNGRENITGRQLIWVRFFDKCLLCMFVFLGCSIGLRAQHKVVTYYSNPILAGFYPDPSICKVGTDYYLVNSTFAYYPGIPIFHSKDLINWQQIGSAMNRPEQLDLDGQGVSRGLFAPTISFHDGRFFICCTQIDKGGNFILTATNPAGPWSNPIWEPAISGIDPSLFFDKGRIYLIYNSEAPNHQPAYEGHRTIRLRELNQDLQPTGEERLLVNGGTDMTKQPVWIEGPHLYVINGWYYLLCAQGGTGTNHSEVVFRSRDLKSPFVPYEHNPILTQSDLEPNRPDPITSTGHADLIEDNHGDWYAVFLGCRPYKDGVYYNTGRETFMAPVFWKDQWPIITTPTSKLLYHYPLPKGVHIDNKAEKFSGNYHFFDRFEQPALNNRYLFLRTVKRKWYQLKQKEGLLVNLRPETCAGLHNPSFIGFRQAHNQSTAIVQLQFEPTAQNEQAGLLIFQNETHYYFLCRTIIQNQQVVALFKSAAASGTALTLMAMAPIMDKSVQLKITSKAGFYNFYYGAKDKKWLSLQLNVDGRFLSTEVGGGFVGCLYAMYATSNGKVSVNKAAFQQFDYRGQDDELDWKGN